MTFAKHFVRGLALGAIGLGLTTGVSAQNDTNWHVLSNGLDALYIGIGGGSGQVGGADGIGSWIDGNDLKGNHITGFGQFGYRQVSFFTSECVLGAPPAIALNFPAIVFIEFDGRNQNAQDVFTRPNCVAGIPSGTTTGGALPYGLSPGASANFLLTGLPSGVGLPSSTTILIPNNGLTTSTGTATIIAAASANLAIASTGFCWNVEFTWLPSALVSFDRVDGWWHWQTNSVNNNQYWSMSNDELNSFSSNTVGVVNVPTTPTLQAFFASFEYEWHSTSFDPVTNTTLNPAGLNGAGPYYAPTGTTPTFNPNGGWDAGRHGGVSISGTGGTINPITGLGTQNPTGSPLGGTPTYGYMVWDNGPFTPGLRTIWHQVDWGGVIGINPDLVAPAQDALVGPPGVRLPVSVSSVYNPGPGWPQAVSLGQFTLQFHTAVSQPDTDPLGFAAGSFGVLGKWAATNQLPIAGLSPVCAIGLPVAIEGGSVGVKADLSDFEFDPSLRRMGTGTSVVVID